MARKPDRWDEHIQTTKDLAHEVGLPARLDASRTLKPSTLKDYQRVARRRLDLDAESYGPLLEDVTRQSWNHHRAALLTILAMHAEQYLIGAHTAAEQDDWAVAKSSAVRARRAVLAYTKVSAATKPPDRSVPKNSKRATLPKRHGWQRDAWAHATPAMRPAVACAMVGARPEEIEKGVIVERVEDAGAHLLVKVTIRGAKVTETTGQPKRVLTLRADSQEGQALLETIPAGQSRTEITRRAKRINLDWRQTIRPRLGENASSYSLRHQFAATLKAAGFDNVTIAKAMGHRSTRSQKHYGTRRQGKGGNSPLIDAEATYEIRTGPDTDAGVDPDMFEP
jgi:hypothetical protein